MLAGDTTDASAADTTVKVNTKPAPVSQDAKQVSATATKGGDCLQADMMVLTSMVCLLQALCSLLAVRTRARPIARRRHHAEALLQQCCAEDVGRATTGLLAAACHCFHQACPCWQEAPAACAPAGPQQARLCAGESTALLGGSTCWWPVWCVHAACERQLRWLLPDLRACSKHNVSCRIRPTKPNMCFLCLVSDEEPQHCLWWLCPDTHTAQLQPSCRNCST